MSRRAPPLAWLRAFEAAGRLESFRAAAEELHVTPSAISHHVRTLERHLGRPLFARTGNSVRLTQEGGAYLERISAGFAELAAAASVLGGPAGRRLTIGAFPFLVNEILLPYLSDLQAALPGTSISVVSATHIDRLTDADPARRVDAIVRYGDGRFPGCVARKLTDVALLAVVAPRDARDLDTVLAQEPRIVVPGPFDGWAAWSAATGIALSNEGGTLSFDSYVTAMRAAEQGLGVALGIVPFVDPWIRAGRVRVLQQEKVPVDQSSYLVVAQYADGRPDLDVLADWLIARFEAG